MLLCVAGASKVHPPRFLSRFGPSPPAYPIRPYRVLSRCSNICACVWISCLDHSLEGLRGLVVGRDRRAQIQLVVELRAFQSRDAKSLEVLSQKRDLQETGGLHHKDQRQRW